MNEKKLSSREEVAEYIESNYRKFKVCEGCDSVLKKSTSLCPVCYTYRFDTTKERIFNTTTRIKNGEERKTVLKSDLY